MSKNIKLHENVPVNKFYFIVAGALVLLPLWIFSTAHNVSIVQILGTIIILTVVGAAIYRGYSWLVDLGTNKWLIGIIASGTVLAIILTWLFTNLFTLVGNDKTPISPFIALTIFIGTAILIGHGMKSELSTSLHYPLMLVFAVFGYAVYFWHHLELWFVGVGSSALVVFLIAKVYRSIKKLETEAMFKTQLLKVLLSARWATWYLVPLLVLVFLAVPAVLMLKNIDNWWHLITVISSYMTGFWVSVEIWIRIRNRAGFIESLKNHISENRILQNAQMLFALLKK